MTSVTLISAVAVMPGRNSNSELSMVSTRLVGHDALDGLGRVANVADGGGEFAIRERIDAERRGLADLDLADIGFVDVDLQLHLPQVLGDREQHRRLQ